jgi:hypothetical protein
LVNWISVVVEALTALASLFYSKIVCIDLY